MSKKISACFIVFFSLLAVNLFSQILHTPIKDTIQLTRISVIGEGGEFVNSYEFIRIKGVYYEVDQNFPISYFSCFYSNMEELVKVSDEINVRREKRFLKYFNKKNSIIIDGPNVFKDSIILLCLRNKYCRDEQCNSYKFFYKSINLFTTYYLFNCSKNNIESLSDDKLKIYPNSFRVLTTDYLKWW